MNNPFDCDIILFLIAADSVLDEVMELIEEERYADALERSKRVEELLLKIPTPVAVRAVDRLEKLRVVQEKLKLVTGLTHDDKIDPVMLAAEVVIKPLLAKVENLLLGRRFIEATRVQEEICSHFRELLRVRPEMLSWSIIQEQQLEDLRKLAIAEPQA